MNKISFLNTYVNNYDMNETITAVESLINSEKNSYIVAVNVDVIIKINEDTYLKKITDNANIVVVDGMPLIWISKIYGRPIRAKISGSDLVPNLCHLASKKGYSIFILGGKDGVAECAKNNLLNHLPSLNIVGTYAPPLGFEKDEKEIKKTNSIISSSKPDLLFVCFGCPKQEKYIYENIQNYDAKVSICAGATVDFLAGKLKRAPRWMSDWGLEWLFRFFQEPKRLFKRYFIDDLKIFRLIWKFRKQV